MQSKQNISDINTKKKKAWMKYPTSIMFPFESCLVANDYWAILFMGCVSLYVPRVWVAIVVLILFKTHRKIAQSKVEASQPPRELEQIVFFIHMNRLQSLTEAIETNPHLLYCDYKKKSLHSWCEVYKNNKALMVITQMTHKYPKETKLAA